MMTDWTMGPVGVAKSGWIAGVGAAIRKIGAGRPTRVQGVPDGLREDVGLVHEEKPKAWWEYR